MAGRVKVIDLAKELGVTSKDLLVALGGMGLKSKRATSPLDQAAANQLRIQLGRGRELPTESKPKRTKAVREAAPKEMAAKAPGKKAPAKAPAAKKAPLPRGKRAARAPAVIEAAGAAAPPLAS
ncbi:MAG: translation initiation factor IF-2 N-terminal domain-containing protein, partial [Candidatus Methylomirabilia bacterium]